MLSKLQQFILEACVEGGGAIGRSVVDKNPDKSSSKAQAEHYKQVITASIERLIDRGLLIGYGAKTAEKLFITRIRLTPAGKREALAARKTKQQKIPYVRNKNRSV
ncbi:MAG: hypothetical protein HYT31_01325 [Parcubacteria group bacterium]|nr:hypothetical protein [Parcubacteria group bacterium]